MIITSVVPPELPIELSLAVNASVAALMRVGVFCTEPWRITLAGQVDVACFDKTGTITADEFRVDGIVALLDKRGGGDGADCRSVALLHASRVPAATRQVCALQIYIVRCTLSYEISMPQAPAITPRSSFICRFSRGVMP